MVSLLVLTAAPAEVEPRPVLASALVKALRTEAALSVASALVLALFDDRMVRLAPLGDETGGAIGAEVVPFAVAADTVPPGALVVAVPGAVPPVVATQTSRSEVGNCV